MSYKNLRIHLEHQSRLVNGHWCAPTKGNVALEMETMVGDRKGTANIFHTRSTKLSTTRFSPARSN
jgi:hypothetical protein